MRMDHALAVAAGLAPGPEQILSAAGRLARDAETGTAPPVLAPSGLGAMPPLAATPQNNLSTLRSCQGLLADTLRMLE